MKYLTIFLMFCSSLVFSQDDPPLGWSNSELFFITTGLNSGDEVQYVLEGIGARWDADDTSPPSNFALSTDYSEGWYPDLGDTGKSNVSTVSARAYFANTWGFDFINAGQPINDYVVAYGIYKISTSLATHEDGSSDAYFFLDYRDTRYRTYQVGSGSAIDVWFIYDGDDDQFGYNRYTCGITNNPEDFIDITHGGYLPIWEIKEQSSSSSPDTEDFEDYWENCMVMIDDGNDHPRLVWGPHPSFTTTHFYLYRSVEELPLDPKEPFTWSLRGTFSATTYEFIDTEIDMGGDPDYLASWYVKAYDSSIPSFSVASNSVNTNGEYSPFKIGSDKQNEAQSLEFKLNQNYPNPFNPATTINYSIKNDGLVLLKVYDVLGKEVATLVNENKPAGSYQVDFNASKLPSGIYLYKLISGNFTETKKLILMK